MKRFLVAAVIAAAIAAPTTQATAGAALSAFYNYLLGTIGTGFVPEDPLPPEQQGFFTFTGYVSTGSYWSRENNCFNTETARGNFFPTGAAECITSIKISGTSYPECRALFNKAQDLAPGFNSCTKD